MPLICRGAVFSTVGHAAGTGMISDCLGSKREEERPVHGGHTRDAGRIADCQHRVLMQMDLGVALPTKLSLWLPPLLMMESIVTIDGGIN